MIATKVRTARKTSGLREPALERGRPAAWDDMLPFVFVFVFSSPFLAFLAFHTFLRLSALSKSSRYGRQKGAEVEIPGCMPPLWMVVLVEAGSSCRSISDGFQPCPAFHLSSRSPPSTISSQNRSMPLNPTNYLTERGWGGKGTSLDSNGRGLKKPLSIPQKRSLTGIGKDRDRAVEWWDCLFAVSFPYRIDSICDGEGRIIVHKSSSLVMVRLCKSRQAPSPSRSRSTKARAKQLKMAATV